MTWKKELKKEILDKGLDMGEFTSQELFKLSLKSIQNKFPKNNTCKASIQRTLRLLRDDGFLRSIDNNGTYEVISDENKQWTEFVNKYHINKKKGINCEKIDIKELNIIQLKMFNWWYGNTIESDPESEQVVESEQVIESEQVVETEDKIKGYFRRSRGYLSQGLRNKAWVNTYGENFNVKCYCCNLSTINPFNCVWGHILSHAEGGDTSIKNMKPICSCCNTSMGKTHMNDFKRELNN